MMFSNSKGCRNAAIAVVACAALSQISIYSFAKSQHASPYAGQQARQITSLSEKDIDDLRAGRGWGLAKPAELNGYPGPRHVLDLKDKLNLTSGQRAAIQEIFDRMQADAREIGAKLIAGERALDVAFRRGDMAAGNLADLLATTEAARAKLRYIHLSAHLETTSLLSRHQRHQYQNLRGYTGASGSGHDGHQHQ